MRKPEVNEYREMELQELKKFRKDLSVSTSILIASYLLSLDRDFIDDLPDDIKGPLLDLGEIDLASFDTYKKLHSGLEKCLFISSLNELYLSCNSTSEIKNSVLMFTLSEQIGVTVMMGYYYDAHIEFLINSIKTQITDHELKCLLIKKADTLKLKEKLLQLEFLYLSPSELLQVTREDDLIIKYIRSRKEFDTAYQLNVFEDILSKISSEELTAFKEQNARKIKSTNGEVVMFSKRNKNHRK